MLAAFLALLVAGPIFFPPKAAPVFFFGYIVLLGALLLGVCWLKGEPTRWRWGSDDHA